MTGLNETLALLKQTKKNITLLDITNVVSHSVIVVIFLDMVSANCCVKILSGIPIAAFPFSKLDKMKGLKFFKW